jgi:hypothetical protein
MQRVSYPFRPRKRGLRPRARILGSCQLPILGNSEGKKEPGLGPDSGCLVVSQAPRSVFDLAVGLRAFRPMI